MPYVGAHAQPGEGVADGGLVGDPDDVGQCEQPGEEVAQPVGLALVRDAGGQGLVEGAEHDHGKPRLGQGEDLAGVLDGERGGGAVEEVALDEQGLVGGAFGGEAGRGRRWRRAGRGGGR